MLLPPDPLRTERALVDTALSVVKDLRVSKATRVARDLVSSRNYRHPPTHPNAGCDPPGLPGTPNSASETRSPTAILPPQPQIRGCASLAVGLFCLETRDLKQAGRLLQRAHLPQTPIRKPFAYQPPDFSHRNDAEAALRPRLRLGNQKYYPRPNRNAREIFGPVARAVAL